MNTTKTQADKSGDDEATEAQQAIGKLLQETRINQGLEISDVARVLRISQRYLEAIEESRNQDLPGAAYAIGFVRSFAEHLQLDGEEIVRRYKAEVEGLEAKTNLVFPKPIPEGGVPGGAVLGVGVLIAFLAYGAWYWNSNNDTVTITQVDPVPEHLAVPKAEIEKAPKAVPEDVKVDEKIEAVVEEVVKTAVEAAPEVVSEAVKVPTPSATAVAEPEVVVPEVVAVVEVPKVETPKVELAHVEPVKAEAVKTEVAKVEKPKAPLNDGPSRITVRAKSNSWIQIRDQHANRLLFTRLLRKGDEYEVPNRAGLRLMTGNAGALEVLVDGKTVPSIGGVGDVRRNVDLDPEKLKSGSATVD